jgi:hypothetical protein
MADRAVHVDLTLVFPLYNLLYHSISDIPNNPLHLYPFDTPILFYVIPISFFFYMLLDNGARALFMLS